MLIFDNAISSSHTILHPCSSWPGFNLTIPIESSNNLILSIRWKPSLLIPSSLVSMNLKPDSIIYRRFKSRRELVVKLFDLLSIIFLLKFNIVIPEVGHSWEPELCPYFIAVTSFSILLQKTLPILTELCIQPFSLSLQLLVPLFILSQLFLLPS